MADASTMEPNFVISEFIEKEEEMLRQFAGNVDESNDVGQESTSEAEARQQWADKLPTRELEATSEPKDHSSDSVPGTVAADHSSAVSIDPNVKQADEQEIQKSYLATVTGDAGPRASISLQRVASVEEISRAIARAEQGRPRIRRRRQESETMQQWKKDFEERLRIKDELEAGAIENLKKQAEKDKQEWYAQWQADLAQRRELRRVEKQEEADALQESNSANCWQRMSRIAKSLCIRRESKDLNRMRALLIALEKPPKRTVLV
ncbi:hypothetical protein BIW11_05172 [Tropilaelaps mercedesae]|uniref:Clathrin light chain n=1 Tax=Tropilaelaps mercedesae TaxID=418985 RepID=A0A1V9Y3G2_9ACAR|nr:hypothetical protein BIW11_05172 [Tropilaelaps mercedesae]